MTYEFPLLVRIAKTEVHQDSPKAHLQALDPVTFPCSEDTESNTKEHSNNDKQHRFPCSVNAEGEQELLPYTTAMVWRKLPTAICINKNLLTRYRAPTITEYLDPSTGEIIQASKLRNDARVPPQIHFGEIQLLRQSLMNSLRREIREFALFVLQFRNNRRGLTPEVGTLVEWYAHTHGKRPSNVRRYLTALQKASFLAGESLLSPLFQRTGKNVTSKDHLGEDVVARCTLLKMRMKATSVQTSFL